MNKIVDNLCPCGTSNLLTECCMPLIKGVQKAQTAEQLMRSRFTAFVIKDAEYPVRTHDPRTRGHLDIQGVQQWMDKCDFTRLEILKTENGMPGDLEGKVHFKAFFSEDGGPEDVHEEKSLFRFLEGQWFFTDGKAHVESFQRDTLKIGRNDPCNCGSGKKFKKCCG